MTPRCPPLPDRIADKIEVGDCWHWKGAINRGYGRVAWQGHNRAAYRVVWELLVSKVPEGLELDHLCRNRSCVNPAHLDVVTHQQNMQRGYSATRAKTHCPQGHPYDAMNTYVAPKSGARHCRACKRSRS